MARILLASLALVSLHNAVVSAASLVLKIQPSAILPNPNALPPSTHATITSPNGNVRRSILQQDNTIHFNEIPSVGSHLLNVYTKDYTFASYRIDTTPNLTSASSSSETSILISFAAQTYPGTQWSDTGLSLLPQVSSPSSDGSTSSTSKPVSSLTFTPRILAAKNFYETRAGFSPLSLLKNPMILLAVVALAFTFGMPKLMENMDPEMKAEYEEMQKKGPSAAIGKAMSGQYPASGGNIGEGFDLAGYLAGQKKEGVEKK